METMGTPMAENDAPHPNSTPSSTMKSGPHSVSMAPAPAAVGHPLLEIVRGELERVFSLEELLVLARDSLGFDANEIGGTSAKGSFSRGLVDFCAQHDAIEALIDAV